MCTDEICFCKAAELAKLFLEQEGHWNGDGVRWFLLLAGVDLLTLERLLLMGEVVCEDLVVARRRRRLDVVLVTLGL